MPEEVRADLLIGRDTLSPGLVKAGRAASDASSNVRQLTRDLYEAGKVRATPIVDLNDADATLKLEDVSAKLKELGAKVADPSINVEDKEAQAALASMRVKLDVLGRKVASPRVTLEGLDRAEAGILALDASLDRLSRKHATPDVSAGGGGIFSRLAGLLGGGGSGAGGAASAGGSLAGGTFTGPAIGIAAALGSALFPALIPLALGGATGLGGGLLAGRLGVTGLQKLQQDRQALQRAQIAVNAPGKASQSQLLSLHQAQSQLARDQARYGGFAPFGRQVTQLGNTGLDALLGALTSKSQGFSGGPGGHPGTSFLGGLTDILKQLGGFVKEIGPQLGDLFRASLPFVQAFVKIMEQFAKAVLPSITQSLKLLQPDLPIIIKGFLYLSQGIAGFIQNLGPGIRDSAVIFKGAMLVVKGFLQLAGLAASDFAKGIVDTGRGIRDFARNIPGWFDNMRHETAVIFDGVRHDIAHIWDLIFQNTIGRADRGLHDIAHEFDVWRHDVASIFDTFKHDVAAVWDTIWNNTEGREIRGIRDIVGWFEKLPGDVTHALLGLGSKLYSLGHTWLTDMFNGIKSVWHGVLSFFGNIPGDILHALGIHSPPDWAISAGKDIMKGLHIGIGAARGAVSSIFGGGAGGGIGGSVVSWITAAMRLAHAPSSWLPALERLVSLESGGNPRAVNPTAVLGEHASGLWQMLPSTFAGYGGVGSLFNPILEGVAALKYISAVYGSPFNIPGLFSGGYRGYASGGWITEPILGVGRSGRMYGFGENGPEMVVPGGGRSGAGQTVIVNVQLGHGTHPVAAAQEIAKLLNAGARNGVRLRTSILGPG